MCQIYNHMIFSVTIQKMINLQNMFHIYKVNQARTMLNPEHVMRYPLYLKYLRSSLFPFTYILNQITVHSAGSVLNHSLPGRWEGTAKYYKWTHLLQHSDYTAICTSVTVLPAVVKSHYTVTVHHSILTVPSRWLMEWGVLLCISLMWLCIVFFKQISLNIRPRRWFC